MQEPNIYRYEILNDQIVGLFSGELLLEKGLNIGLNMI